MSIRRRSAGFTLLEVTVYSALLGVLMLAIYAVLVASMRYWQVAQASADLQGSAEKTVAYIVNDVSESTLLGMRLDTSPSGVIFLSARDPQNVFQINAYGQIVWQQWICYYYDSAGRKIIRQSQRITPTVVPPLNNNTTQTFAALAGGKVVATNVTSFSITGTSTLSIQASFDTTVFSNAANTADSQLQIIDLIATRNN